MTVISRRSAEVIIEREALETMMAGCLYGRAAICRMRMGLWRHYGWAGNGQSRKAPELPVAMVDASLVSYWGGSDTQKERLQAQSLSVIFSSFTTLLPLSSNVGNLDRKASRKQLGPRQALPWRCTCRYQPLSFFRTYPDVMCNWHILPMQSIAFLCRCGFPCCIEESLSTSCTCKVGVTAIQASHQEGLFRCG